MIPQANLGHYLKMGWAVCITIFFMALWSHYQTWQIPNTAFLKKERFSVLVLQLRYGGVLPNKVICVEFKIQSSRA